MSAPASKPAATAPLLYWLALVAGLVGFSVLRARTHDLEPYEVWNEIGPIWVGSVAGVALGQLLAFLRIRAWVPMVVLVIGSVGPGLWLFGMLMMFLDAGDRGVVETAFVAFAPAAVSGYLALSERGALVSFWYPTALWMVVLLDGQSSPTAFDRRAALPLVVGLGALFIAFLRARETRRAALWRAHAGVRLAGVRSRTVLRKDPLRGVLEHVGVGLVGGAALMLAGWIAPHLWQVQKLDEPAKAAVAAGAHGVGTSADGTSPPCCDAAPAKKKVARVTEYFPLHAAAQEKAYGGESCISCASGGTQVASSTGDDMPYYGDGTGLYKPGIPYSSSPLPAGDPALPAATPTETTSSPTTTTDLWTMPDPVPAPAQPSVVKVQPPEVHAAPKVLDPPKPIVTPASPKVDDHHGVVATTAPTHASAAPSAGPPPRPSVPLEEPGAPWKGILVMVAGAIALHMTGRAVRRAVVLRHLGRPFWRETVDQRISNHWERVLIALRDAGIAPVRDEQPMTFAKRVGIEGMETCASILERVRHGVRIEPLDLESMGRASSVVYAAARRRAGVVAGALSWLRSPTV